MPIETPLAGLGWAAYVIACVLVILLSFAMPLLPLLLVIAPLLLYLSIKHSFLGMVLFIIMHFFYIRSTEDINVGELAFGLYAVILLSTWLFRRWFLSREPISQGLEDYALFGFISLCVLSFIPAILSGSSPLRWLRELIPLSFYLFVFPMRDAITNSKRIKILLLFFLALALIIATKNIWTYYQLVSGAEKIWEFLAFRQTYNEPILLTVFIVSLALGIYLPRFRHRLACLIVSATFCCALVLTFSRGYWVAAIMSIFVLFFLSSSREKLRLFQYSLLGGAILIVVALVLFGPITQFVTDAIASRFETLGDLGQDLSLKERFKESSTVYSHIKLSPFVGYGLGKLYSFRSLIGRDMPTHYVHNAYLYFVFKLGLFALLCLMTFYATLIVKGYKVLRNTGDPFTSGLTTGILAVFISFIPLSVTSPQFVQKDSILIIVLGGAILLYFFHRSRALRGGRTFK